MLTTMNAQIPNVRPYRILVVEDDSEMRELLKDELTDGGYDVVLAVNGEEAMGIMDRDAVDLVITDIRMPKVGGFELLPRLKRHDSKLPVIVITAFGDWPTLSEAYDKGACDYIDKPFKILDLKRSVRKALEERRKEE